MALRAARTPRAFSSAASAGTVLMPDACSCRISGIRLAAKASVLAHRVRAFGGSLGQVRAIAQHHAPVLRMRQCNARAL